MEGFCEKNIFLSKGTKAKQIKGSAIKAIFDEQENFLSNLGNEEKEKLLKKEIILFAVIN
ncbi:MAG: hypothetical protein QRY72_02130 [Candidatus Rhabdochlamydia sp.]